MIKRVLLYTTLFMSLGHVSATGARSPERSWLRRAAGRALRVAGNAARRVGQAGTEFAVQAGTALADAANRTSEALAVGERERARARATDAIRDALRDAGGSSMYGGYFDESVCITHYDRYGRTTNYTFPSVAAKKRAEEAIQKIREQERADLQAIEQRKQDRINNALQGATDAGREMLKSLAQRGEAEKAAAAAAREEARIKDQREREFEAGRLAHQKRMLLYGVLGAIGIVGAYWLIPYLLKDKPTIIEPGDTNILTLKERLMNKWLGIKPPQPRIAEFHANKELEERMKREISADRHAIESGGNLTNKMFFGEPGTGKTMMGVALASEIGAKFIIIRGSAFKPLSPQQAVAQAKKIFRFIKTAQGQVVVFWDEPDEMFERRQTNKDVSVLNTFLAFFPKPHSKKYMHIFATNRQDVIDKAILSRIGSYIQFPLPNKDTRMKLFETYINKILVKEGVLVEEEVFQGLDVLAELSDKMSPRTIEFLCIEFAREVYAQNSPALTLEIAKTVLQRRKKDDADKNNFAY